MNIRRLSALLVSAFMIIIFDQTGFAVSQQDIPTETLKRETFISSGMLFDGESLAFPSVIRINPVSGERIVLDEMNTCLYFFGREGNFIRKAGQQGKGPGDLMMPKNLYIDASGMIYVYENANQRISIFDKTGGFIRTVKVIGGKETFFSVSDTMLSVNAPYNGFQISQFSVSGSHIRYLAAVTSFIDDRFANNSFAEGMPYMYRDEIRILYKHRPEIGVYTQSGAEKSMIPVSLPEYEVKKASIYVEPKEFKKTEKGGYRFAHFLQDVFFRNGHLYVLLFQSRDEKNEKIDPPVICVYKLTADGVPVKKYVLDYAGGYEEFRTFMPNGVRSMTCEISEDESYIYFPYPNNAEILLFR